MSTSSIIILAAFVVYLLFMIVIGVFSMKKTNNTEDYFLGGRGLNGWVAALSAQASDMSGWLLMGLPGSIYALGTGQAWIAIGLFLGTVANWLFISKRLRRYTIVANNSLTLPEFLENRYHDKKRVLLFISSLVIVVFFGVSMAGGLDVVINNAKGLAGYLSLTQIHDQATGTASSYGFLTILSTLAWGLGYFGMPHILLRFMGTEDENKLKLSRRIATIWVIISMFIAIFIGIVGYSISKAGHIPAFTDSSQSETLIIKIAMLLSNHGVIAIIFAGIILAGILACTMSTSDSQLLAASSSVSHNLLHDVLHIELS